MYKRYQDIVENELIKDLDEGLPYFIYWLMTRVGLIIFSMLAAPTPKGWKPSITMPTTISHGKSQSYLLH